MNPRVIKLAIQLLVPFIGGATIAQLAVNRPDDQLAKAGLALGTGAAATGAAVLVLGAKNRRWKSKRVIGAHSLPVTAGKASVVSGSTPLIRPEILPEGKITDALLHATEPATSSHFGGSASTISQDATVGGAHTKKVLIDVNRQKSVVRLWAHDFSPEEFSAFRLELEAVPINWTSEKRHTPSLVCCRGEFAPCTDENFENRVAVPLLALGSVYNGRGSAEEVASWFTLQL